MAFPSAKGSDSAKFLANAPSPKVTVIGENKLATFIVDLAKIFYITITMKVRRYLHIELQAEKSVVIQKQGLELLVMLRVTLIILHLKRLNVVEHLGVMGLKLFV